MVLIIKLNTIIKLLSLIPFMPLRIFVETMHFFPGFFDEQKVHKNRISKTVFSIDNTKNVY